VILHAFFVSEVVSGYVNMESS